jgi:hypothetical protein
VNNKISGDESTYQLPSDFLIDCNNGEVLACKYGERLYDRWTAEEVIQIKKDLEAKMIE